MILFLLLVLLQEKHLVEKFYKYDVYLTQNTTT